MNEKPLLKERLLTEISRIVPDERQAKSLRDNIVHLFNEHHSTLAMLNWNERERIKRLTKLLEYKKVVLERRDQTAEDEKRKALGDRYNDYLVSEISSLEWAIKFIKEHSI